MANKTLIPYLPKLKGGKVEAVSLPKVLREWDDEQGKIRLRHLADAIDVPPGADSVYSIPNPWARTILFRRALYDPDHTLHPRILGEWRGLIAMIALKEVRRLTELSVRGIQVSVDSADPDSFRYAVSRVLPDNEDAIAPSATWNNFHLLSWMGERTEGKPRAFAMTSPWTLVATGADYAGVLSEKEVPWFSRQDGVLKDPREQLSAHERTMLAEWLGHVHNGLPAEKGANTEAIGHALKEFAQSLDSRATGNQAESDVFSDYRASCKIPQLRWSRRQSRHFDALRRRFGVVAADLSAPGAHSAPGSRSSSTPRPCLGVSRLSSMRSAEGGLLDQSQDLIGGQRNDTEHKMAHYLCVAPHAGRAPAELVF
jgi:hypothetical protein